ncbi:hypothetical protein TRVL_01580 [Trypanosoma vivax]|nr:hypothetical protein TRVL_01580 [Trypanosoma vivax]
MCIGTSSSCQENQTRTWRRMQRVVARRKTEAQAATPMISTVIPFFIRTYDTHTHTHTDTSKKASKQASKKGAKKNHTPSATPHCTITVAAKKAQEHCTVSLRRQEA